MKVLKLVIIFEIAFYFLCILGGIFLIVGTFKRWKPIINNPLKILFSEKATYYLNIIIGLLALYIGITQFYISLRRFLIVWTVENISQ